jgi:hypothetical protein
MKKVIAIAVLVGLAVGCIGSKTTVKGGKDSNGTISGEVIIDRSSADSNSAQ